LAFTADPDVLIAGNGLVLTANATVYGALLAYGAGGVSVPGNLVLLSDVLVNHSTIVIDGSLVIPLRTNATFVVEHSQIKLGGVLHTSVVLTAGSGLTVTSALAIVVGTIVNQASVTIATQNVLEIYEGDYIQQSGTLLVSLHTENTPALKVINRSIELDSASTLQYSIIDKPFLTNAKFLVATANASLNGTFASDASPMSGSTIDRALPVEIDTVGKTISIQYSFNVKDVEIWMWIVLGVAVALIIIVVIAVIVKCRKRTKYEIVR